jgi:hypothetical protein
MTDNFWAVIQAQVGELTSAATAQDVLRILATERAPGNPLVAGDGFFAGSGGDDSVWEALSEAGWQIIWSRADYYFVAKAPDGSTITYVEGDIYLGDKRT